MVQPLDAILITGDIRSASAFSEELSAAVFLLANSKDPTLIISTWSDKVDVAREIACAVLPRSIQYNVIGTASMQWDMPGNWMRQAKLLLKGLSLFPKDVWVLKMRTDKTSWATSWLEVIERRNDIAPPRTDLVDNRILVAEALVSEPFFYSDMVVGGLAKDLYNLIPTSIIPILSDWTINAEQAFFSAPFIGSVPYIKDFFSSYLGLPHHHSSHELRLRLDIILASESALKSIVHSLSYLRDCFWMPADNGSADGISVSKDPKVSNVSFRDFISSENVGSTDLYYFDPISNCTVLRSTMIIDRLLESTIENNGSATLASYTNLIE